MHNNPEFSRAGATTQVEDGNFRLSTRFLEHCPAALPPINQKRVTQSAALIPNAAFLSWGRVITYEASCLAAVCFVTDWVQQFWAKLLLLQGPPTWH